MASSNANAEQIEYWNEVSGPRWVAAQERLDSMIEELGVAGIERAQVEPGERVIDVGCGCGASSLALAARVGSQGSVQGLDISLPMLARARERARHAGFENLRFDHADAQTHRFEGDADLVFSRFGVMFFDDPVAAFRNLHSALTPGGRIAFVCWQPLEQNPWMARPMEVVNRFVPPRPRLEPGAPGPFAFADPDRVRGILRAAGFAEIEVHRVTGVQRLGTTADLALAFLLDGVGPVASALAEVQPGVRAAVARDLRELLAEHQTPRGVEFDTAVWIPTARKPLDP